MAITLDGTLGITTPAETVQGALTTTGNTILGDATTDTLNVGNGGLVKDASGNVGIGTSSPSVYVGFTTLEVGNTSGNAGLFSAKHANGNAIMYNSGGIASFGSTGAYSTIFISQSVERMRIDASGNVNIGSSSNYGGLLSVNRAQTASVADFLTLRDASAGITFNLQTYADPSTGTANRFNYDGAYLAFRRSGTEQMRIDSSGNLLFNSGYGSAATAYGCRAWVNFNGTGTVAIRASGNVSSITDNNTGDYTVNFTTAMVDANYITAGTATRNVLNNYASFFSPYVTITTSTIRIQAVNFSGATEDSLHTSVAIFR